MNLKPTIVFPEFEKIRPSLSEVNIVMGYPPESDTSVFRDILTILLDEAESHVTAAAIYSIFEIHEINIPQGLITHDQGILKCGSKIAKQMAGSDSFAMFISTSGTSFDDWIKSQAPGDILKEYLCSSIGSVVADKVADIVHYEINSIAVKSGKGITNRYSPGYCSWNVREQKGIFDLLPAGKIGVTLTPSFLMKPIKSVSGIIGIGSGLTPGPYMCDLCNMTNCLVKRARG